MGRLDRVRGGRESPRLPSLEEVGQHVGFVLGTRQALGGNPSRLRGKPLRKRPKRRRNLQSPPPANKTMLVVGSNRPLSVT